MSADTKKQLPSSDKGTLAELEKARLREAAATLRNTIQGMSVICEKTEFHEIRAALLKLWHQTSLKTATNINDVPEDIETAYKKFLTRKKVDVDSHLEGLNKLVDSIVKSVIHNLNEAITDTQGRAAYCYPTEINQLKTYQTQIETAIRRAAVSDLEQPKSTSAPSEKPLAEKEKPNTAAFLKSLSESLSEFFSSSAAASQSPKLPIGIQLDLSSDDDDEEEEDLELNLDLTALDEEADLDDNVESDDESALPTPTSWNF